MKTSFYAAYLLPILGCKATTTHDFGSIQASPNLTWTPCFDTLSCAKLQVPLDYANPGLGTTDIAFVKLTGKNATIDSPSIVLIPGGPGGSGIDLLLSSQAVAATALGDNYSIVSFDPRGVNNSGPKLDCFQGAAEARQTFLRLHSTGVTNLSTNSVQDQYYSAQIYGDRCNYAVAHGSPHGYYVTTPAVARDLLSFVEAEAVLAGRPPAKAKLWSYGVSYGTVISSTFASMFPDRVGRMVLDGVVDADQYYHNDWSDGIDQMDAAVKKFASLCHSAGKDKCSFWGPTPDDILKRLEKAILNLQSHPIAISGMPGDTLPALVTVSDLKAFILAALYTPLQKFPILADALHQLEQGNATALVGRFAGLAITDDPSVAIRCVDSYRRNSLSTVDGFRRAVEKAISRSKYLGDLWIPDVESVLCWSLKPELPDSLVVKDTIGGRQRKTAFPILFTSNTIDPVTPLKSARAMHSRFPGSSLLQQEAIGHVVLSQGGSVCYMQHIQAYFAGVVPPANTTCPQQFVPFVNHSPV
ncbi:hypothetical protein VHEMI10422 [[Torrubiella] hemipterigena]|uniref:AB hydrolase-1 domain-containing protein n=1 Tax=[Torrubiella] hemipterigena TaxID=1531966 RepID=A0A0A1TRT7_9HYPO|nr:hypothetical protein VHEMI10422 [[Torrubiella] hemipterigena]